MASPQAENGHTDIANEILEALGRFRIPGEQWQILTVVFRKTYGWHKVEDEISLSQFAEATGLNRSNVARAIKGLVSKAILAVVKTDTTHANKYRFNKDFETWKAVVKADTPVSKVTVQAVSKVIHTKETITKENIYALQKFVKPSQEDVAAYCHERKNGVDPQKWFDFYESKGWKIGKNSMKNWKAAVRTWEKNIVKPKTESSWRN